ncbi:uncharacterized protein VTP21DRAFT_5632 [Calcarisporiella thermophila]|uniref:uncharacterized protein n=1 Tax=Calcarisporiella thermophila TaxID=911321 RepID=UPI00374271EE
MDHNLRDSSGEESSANRRRPAELRLDITPPVEELQHPDYFPPAGQRAQHVSISAPNSPLAQAQYTITESAQTTLYAPSIEGMHEDEKIEDLEQQKQAQMQPESDYIQDAVDLVRKATQHHRGRKSSVPKEGGGVLSNLLRLQSTRSPQSSARATPRRPHLLSRNSWTTLGYRDSVARSSTSGGVPGSALGQMLLAPGTMLGTIGDTSAAENLYKRWSMDGRSIDARSDVSIPPSERMRITEAIADVLQRQDFLLRLCKGFLMSGAPSHRLETALDAASKAVGIDAQFAFLPNLTLVSFGDAETHTSETHILKIASGLDMGRLVKLNRIYTRVVKQEQAVPEALHELDEILNAPPYYKNWVLLLAYTSASMAISPIAFQGSWADSLASGFVGLIVGGCQLLANRSPAYSNVFEISVTVIISFLARLFVMLSKSQLVCFSSIVLSALVLILPGYPLIAAVLELSSKQLITGSVRLFYSLIYSLILGFGVSIGSAFFDFIFHPNGMHSLEDDPTRVCSQGMSEWWQFLFVPIFSLSLNVVPLKGEPRQWPLMSLFGVIGYVVNWAVAKRYGSSPQVSSAIGAFVVGVLANISSRLRRGRGTSGTAYVNIITGVLMLVPASIGVKTSFQNLMGGKSIDITDSSNFAIQMVVISLGISVGLFAASILVYAPPPVVRKDGIKRRSRVAFMTF